MPKLSPIHWRKFEKFLFYVGCHFARSKGAHRIYKRKDLARPVVVTVSKKNAIPVDHIKTNLFTLGMDVDEYLKILDLM